METDLAPYTLDSYSALLESIYGGLEKQPLWEDFLAHLKREMDANICFLILRTPVPGDPGVLLSDGLPAPLTGHNIYSDGLYALDPFVNLPAGRVVLLEEFQTSEALIDSEFYQRCLKPFDIQQILGVDMQLTGGMRASLRITRGPNSSVFDTRAKRKVELLLPHLQRAIPLYVKLRSMEAERTMLDRTVSQLALGTIILDEQRRVLQCNAIAERILARHDGISCKEQQIQLSHNSEARRFRQLLSDALEVYHEARPQIVQAMALPRSHMLLPLNIVVRSLPKISYVDGQANPAVAIFLSDPENKSQTSAELLGQLYGLTPAESRLAMALADGLSLEEASNTLHISRNTARAHLRAIFSKTGVTQQTMLVSLLLKSVAAFLAQSGE